MLCDSLDGVLSQRQNYSIRSVVARGRGRGGRAINASLIICINGCDFQMMVIGVRIVE